MNLDLALRRRLKLSDSKVASIPLSIRIIAANLVLFWITLILAGMLKR